MPEEKVDEKWDWTCSDPKCRAKKLLKSVARALENWAPRDKARQVHGPRSTAPGPESKNSDPESKKLDMDRWMQGFEEFWKLYPRRVAKARAEREWIALAPASDAGGREVYRAIMRSLRLARSGEWATESGGLKEMQFIPHPATWLRRERFD